MGTPTGRPIICQASPGGVRKRPLKRCVQNLWLLVLALWLPCTMHCSLEAAGLTLSNCCESSAHEEHPSAAPAGDPCHDCPDCASVESGGLVKSGQSAKVQPVPVTLCLLVLFATPAPPTPAGAFLLRALSPPELPPAWRFAERVALPPRAPSRLG